MMILTMTGLKTDPQSTELSTTSPLSLMPEQLQFPALARNLNLNLPMCFVRQRRGIKIKSKIKITRNGGIEVARPDLDFDRFY